MVPGLGQLKSSVAQIKTLKGNRPDNWLKVADPHIDVVVASLISQPDIFRPHHIYQD